MSDKKEQSFNDILLKEKYIKVFLTTVGNIQDLDGNCSPSPTVLADLPVFLGSSAALKHNSGSSNDQGKNVYTTDVKHLTSTL